MLPHRFIYKCSVLISLSFLTLSVFSQQNIKKWTLKDAMGINNITNINFSPDDQYLTYVLSKNVKNQEQVWISDQQIHRINLKDLSDETLTNKGYQYSQPKWSFDGQYIAYLFQDENQDVAHLWRMKPDGSEKEQITENTNPITCFEWSPNRYAIGYVTTSHYPTIAPEEQNLHPANINNTFTYSNLHLLELKDSLPSPDKILAAGLGNRNKFYIFDWNNSGDTILFSKVKSNRNDLWNYGDLTQFNFVNQTEQPVSMMPKQRPVQAAQYSHDNTQVALLSSKLVYIMNTDTGGLTQLATDDGELPIDLIGWSQDDQYVYVLEKYHTYYRMLALSSDGKKYRIIPLPHQMITSPVLSKRGDKLGLTLQDSNKPIEIFLYSIKKSKPKKLTHSMQAMESEARVSIPR